MAVNKREELLRFNVETGGDAELAALADRLSDLAKGSDKTASQAQALVAELEKLAATSANIKQFTTLKASLADTGEQLQKAKEKLAGLGAEFDRADKPTAQLQRSLAKAAKDVENLTREQNKQQVALSKTTTALKAAGVDTDKLGAAYHDLQGKLDGFKKRTEGTATALERAGRQSKSAAAGVSTLDKAASAGAKSLAAIAARLTLVSGAATTAIQGIAALTGGALFVGAIRSATTLEEALSQVRAVSGATADEMVKLKEAAEQGGATTKFSSLEAAQGLGELARATGSAQAAIAALPATLDLAQAAGIGVAEAAQFITTTLTQFGLGATEASRVADVLAKASNSTTADVEGLGNALSYAAPLAKQLGMDTEGTVAIIGALADQGFRGERAGTALRQVFSQMLDPTSTFAKALRDLGIESSDFATIIEQLGKKGDLGRQALLQLDAAARPAILALVASGGTALRQLDGDLRNATGSARETARVMGDNLSGAAESIKDSFDRTRRSLVEPLLAPLKDELFELSKELEQFAQSPEFEEIKGALKDLFVEGADAARKLLQEVDFHALAENIKSFVGEAGTDLQSLNENIGEIVTTVEVIGRTFQVVFNAIQATILGLAAVVAKIISMIAGLSAKLEPPQLQLMKFFGIIDQTGAESLQGFADGMQAVSDEFGMRFTDNVVEAVDAAKALAAASTDAGDKSEAGFGKAATAGEAHAVASEHVAEAADAAKGALAGQAQGAVDAAGQTERAAASTESSAERLKKAFADMGIQSQAELQRAASAAQHNFDLIQQAVGSGEASAEDARRAFAAYAQAARAAVADSDATAKERLESELKVKAAILDAAGAFNLLGDAGDSALKRVKPPADAAAGALGNLGNSAKDAAAQTKSVGDESVGAGEKAKKSADDYHEAAFGLTAMSDEAVKALQALNHLASNSEVWTKAWNSQMQAIREQKTELSGMNDELDAQLAKFDPLNEKLATLKQQYNFVDDATLRSIAEKQQRLEQERKRVEEESQRVAAQATQQVAQPARQANTATPVTSTTPARPATGTAPVATPERVVVLRFEADDRSAQVSGTPEAIDFITDLLRSKAVSIKRRR